MGIQEMAFEIFKILIEKRIALLDPKDEEDILDTLTEYWARVDAELSFDIVQTFLEIKNEKEGA